MLLQTLTAKSDDVLEAMSLLSCPPTVESDHSVTYTFHTVTKRFPSHVNRTEYPRLRLSGTNVKEIEIKLLAYNMAECSPFCVMNKRTKLEKHMCIYKCSTQSLMTLSTVLSLLTFCCCCLVQEEAKERKTNQMCPKSGKFLTYVAPAISSMTLTAIGFRILG